jgi:glycosyltransferase involved in cell wall biosynthesis
MFHLVGGTENDVKRHEKSIEKENLRNVILYGMQPHANVPRFLWYADVLLLTHTNNHPSANFTSPVKLAEYFAAEEPVIAAKIPSLLDWLNDEVFFDDPDNPNSLIATIQLAIRNKELCNEKVLKAKNKAIEWSYIERIKKILTDTND